ncbi:MAG: hypothetical protein AAFN93_20865 [Bacteroidota bacterium]
MSCDEENQIEENINIDLITQGEWFCNAESVDTTITERRLIFSDDGTFRQVISRLDTFSTSFITIFDTKLAWAYNEDEDIIDVSLIGPTCVQPFDQIKCTNADLDYRIIQLTDNQLILEEIFERPDGNPPARKSFKNERLAAFC